MLKFNTFMAAAVAAEQAGKPAGAVAVKQEIDGRPLPEGMTVERISPLLDGLMLITVNARKAQTVIDKRRGSVADDMLAIARQCNSFDEWNVCYELCKIRYKAQHTGSKVNLPKVMTQTASDIGRMFKTKVDLHAKDETGTLYTYSKLKSAASKQQRVFTSKIRDANEKAKPEWLKTTETQVSLLFGLAKPEGRETWPENFVLFDEVNEFLKAKIEEYLADRPQVEPIDPDLENEATAEHQEAESARATA